MALECKDKGLCYVIILNYNNWRDTIECLETVLKTSYRDFKVIVCDNGSTNDSYKKMIEWAQGKIIADCSDRIEIRSMVLPFVNKPIEFSLYDREKAVHTKLTFVNIKKNLGFAGGMNVGIRIALLDKKCKFIWCLNNDTVVRKDVMSKMIKLLCQNANCGICSSYTRKYSSPNEYDPGLTRIKVNKWLGTNTLFLEDSDRPIDQFKDYDGASFMVTRKFIEDIGLMEEKYFLYFEEPDWTLRGWKAGYKVVYCKDGVVYHKGGASTKSDSRSLASDYYMIRSRILFTKKFYPYCIPTVYLGLIASIINRIRRRQYKRVWMILRLMINPQMTFSQYIQEER